MDTVQQQAAETASQAANLRQAVKANEDVKKVIRISSEINLVAINAMLVAKRSGERSRGFGVVSSELRLFSRKLESAMARLGTLIFGLVRDASAMQKQSRGRRHLLNTMAQSGRVKELVEPVLMRKEDAVRKTGHIIETNWQTLQFHLARTLQLCETGNALVRSAKIEAVYGGDMSMTLGQVATQIEEAVNEILATLKQLQSNLTNY